MAKRDLERTSGVAGNLATQAGERIVQMGGGGLDLVLPGGGGTYIATGLPGPARERVVEVRRNGVLIDKRVMGNSSRRVIEARRAFLAEFEELMLRMPELIRAAHDRRRVDLIGRRSHGGPVDGDAVERALDAARRHGIGTEA